MIYRIRRNHWHIPAVALLFAMLGGCLEAEKEALSYTAINRTDTDIVAIAVNDKGGVLNASAQSGGGDAICCVLLPKEWRPGLTAEIAWREDGQWQTDANGKEIIKDGRQVYVPEPWKKKTVEIPRYPKEMGTFYIVFFPNDEVRVAIKNGYPTEILPKDDPLQPNGK